MRRYRWGARVAMIAVGAAALGVAASGWAANASFACRLAIAKGASKVTLAGYKSALTCRKAADKAAQATGPCDVPGSASFDPSGKYGTAKSNGMALITGKCTGGDPVLGNYDGGDPAGAVFPEIESAVGGNQLGTAGNANLSTGNPPDLSNRTKCVEAIVKAEASIVKEIVVGGTKCQKGKDKSAASFGPLDPSCLLTGTKSVPKATGAISKACGSLNPSDIGTCSPLPDCATSNTVTAAQDIVQAIYFKKAAASTCGNSIIEGSEQCDDGANNGQAGDLCNTKCESLAETCGPGTPAGGTINGHRIVTVSLGMPTGKQLAGVQVAFDYPQLEASIPGTGSSSVVRGAVHVFPTGGLLAVNDTDTDFHFALANTTEFIGPGQLFQTTLDECTMLSQNVCNRNQNVIGCCPLANLDACTNDQNTIDQPTSFAAYYDDCKCGAPLRGVQLSDCTTGWKFFADHGACTTGACASPPTSIKCTNECTAGGFSKLNPHPAACTAGTVNTDCASIPTCDDPGTLTCTDGDPAKIGMACTAATEATDCGPIPTPTCSSGKFCTAGDAGQLGAACSINNDCGTPITVATCEACPELGDRTNGTFGCPDVYNSVICTPGHFPSQAVGGCDGTANGPTGGCPLGNTCEKQDEITTLSCSLINPVDHLGQPVDGVTCSIAVTEAP
jgi:hypothetical protein